MTDKSVMTLADALVLLNIAQAYAEDGALITAADRATSAAKILQKLHDDKMEALGINQKKPELPDNTETGPWYKFGEYHWYKLISGERLHYWPTTGKYQFKGRIYNSRRSLPSSVRKYANR